MPVDQVAYTRILAHVPGLVEHAWVAREEGAGREILLPDGRGLLQVVLGADEGARLVDVATGGQRADVTGVRGLMTHAAVRVPATAGVRLGLQLHPSALASAGAPTLVDAWAPAEVLVGESALLAATTALGAGDVARAVDLLVEAVASRRAADAVEAVRFREILQLVDDLDGAVTVAELARAAEVTVSDVHRWSGRFLGVPPARYLSAVRFSVFVRKAVGRGAVRPQAVLQALRWYAEAGFPPREVERTSGMTPVELKRVDERIASLIGVAGAAGSAH
ncbi:MAG: hypothetical protein AAGC49_00460 [Brevundimonas sp.]